LPAPPPHPRADRPRAEANAEAESVEPGNPHVLRELLPRFATLRLGRSRCPVSISSRIARVTHPEANRTAPSSRIRRSTALPAESMNVTASSSTRTDEASRRAVTLDQQRASASTQGPASRPSSVTVAPPGHAVTEIRSIELSQGKTHAGHTGRSPSCSRVACRLSSGLPATDTELSHPSLERGALETQASRRPVWT